MTKLSTMMALVDAADRPPLQARRHLVSYGVFGAAAETKALKVILEA